MQVASCSHTMCLFYTFILDKNPNKCIFIAWMNNDGFVNLTSKDDPAGQNNSRDVTIWWTGGSRGRRCENLLNVNTMWGGSWQLNWGVHNNWVPLGFCAFEIRVIGIKKKTNSSNPELVLGLVLNYLHLKADRWNKSVKQMQAIHFKSTHQVKLPGNPMDFNWWAEMN